MRNVLRKKIALVIVMSMIFTAFDIGPLSVFAEPVKAISGNSLEKAVSDNGSEEKAAAVSENDNSEEITDENNDDDSVRKTTVSVNSPDDSVSDSNISDNAVSDNSASDNNISENNISDNSVSMDTVSDDVVNEGDSVSWDSMNFGYRESRTKSVTPGVSKAREKKIVDEEIEALGASSIPSFYPETWERPSALLSELQGSFPMLSNQSPFGTCWAFATMTSASFFSKLKDGNYMDYSEVHLAYFGKNNDSGLVDPLGGTVGDNDIFERIGGTSNKESSFLNVGGNEEEALRALSKGIGPVTEELCPYPTNAAHDDESKATTDYKLSNSLAYNNNAINFSNAKFINIKENPDLVKAAIMESGCVGTAINLSGEYINGTNASDSTNYYCPDKKNTNHAVTIVGWDDNYYHRNFKFDPMTNGAWLVRNSWTDGVPTALNINTYFWLSYYDESLKDTAYQVNFETLENYDNLYQYDGGQEVLTDTGYRGLGIYNPEYYANVFQVHGGANSAHELLTDVNVFFNNYSNINYKVEIFTNSSYNNPFGGTLVSSSTTTGHADTPGYYKIELKEPVLLDKGQFYTVKVTTNKPAVALEYGYSEPYIIRENGDPIIKITNNVKAVYGQTWVGNSYYKKSTSTESVDYGNACIKAYTKNVDSPIKLIFDTNGGSCATPQKYIVDGRKYGILPVATKRGYDFTGWYDSVMGGTKIEATDIFSGSTDETVYAHYSPKSYTITFNSNGGDTPSFADKSVTFDAAYGSLPTCSRTGYVFDGWYTAKTGGTKIEDTTIVTTDSNATLFARWRAKKYTIEFNSNGGTDTFPDMVVYYDSKYCANQTQWPVPINDGYYFKGWKKDSPTTGDLIKPSDLVRVDLADEAVITLYGTWSDTCYKISYDSGIGAQITDTFDAEIGKKYSLNSGGKLPDTYVQGYIFDGWYTAANGGTKVDDNTLFYEVDDQTLYAHFTKIGFSQQSYDVVVGKKISVALNVPGAKYKSSKKTVAKVDSNGNVKGVKKGNVKITATYDGVSYTCTVKVVNKPTLKGVNSLKVKKTAKFKVKDGSGPITWSSSKPAVATVDANGKVRALKKGNTVITAIRNGIKMKIKLKVTK